MARGDGIPDFVANPRIAGSEALANHVHAQRVEAAAAGKPKRKRKAKPAAGCEGRFEAGTRVVDDPIEAGAKLTARVNLAEHPLEWMAARGRIDPVQYEAGRRFRVLFERAEIGGARGIDPGKVKVDGGGAGDPLDAGVAEAIGMLGRIANGVGNVSYRLLHQVAGAGKTLTEVAAGWPMAGAMQLRCAYVGERFREALDDLVVHLGIEPVARGRLRGRVRGFAARGTAGGVDDAVTAGHVDNHMARRGVSVKRA